MFIRNYFSKIFLIGLISLLFVKLNSFAVTQSSNDKLADKVESTIFNHYHKNFDITVNDKHSVDVAGQVNTYYDKLRIFQIVSKIKGVRDITDDVIVNAPILPDDEIRDNIENELRMVSSILEPERINVGVDNGEVILSGKVSFYRERLMAQTVASWEKGVKGITNNIEVLPPSKAVSDANLKTILNDILNNQFSLEKNVSFTVNHGVVDLFGTVDDLYAKNRIQDEFSSIIGIVKVINNLKIEQVST